MKSKDIIANCIAIALIVLFSVGLFFDFRYIDSLERQVYQRDSLIRELSFSDQLIREYFDISIDTLNHSRSYQLKDNKKTRIIENQEYFVEMNGKKYDFEQFFNEYIKLTQEYNSLVNNYNHLEKENDRRRIELSDAKRLANSLSHSVDSLRGLNSDYQYYLRSIERTYGIVCNTRKEGNVIHYSIKGSPQLDSALRIFPYFKDMAVYDMDSDSWIISIPNKKKIESTVRITYQR